MEVFVKRFIGNIIAIITVISAFNVAHGMMTQGSRVVTRQIGSRGGTRPANSLPRPSYSPTTIEVTQPSQEPAASILSTSKDLNVPISTSYIPDVDQGNASFYWYKIKNAFYNLFKPSAPQVIIRVEEPTTNNAQPKSRMQPGEQKRYYQQSAGPKPSGSSWSVSSLWKNVSERVSKSLTSKPDTPEKFAELLEKKLTKKGTFHTPWGDVWPNYKMLTPEDIQDIKNVFAQNPEFLNQITTDSKSTPMSFDPESGTPFFKLPDDAPIKQFTPLSRIIAEAQSGDNDDINMHYMQKNILLSSDRTAMLMELARDLHKDGAQINPVQAPLFFKGLQRIAKMWEEAVARKLENEVGEQRWEPVRTNHEIETTRKDLETSCAVLKEIIPQYADEITAIQDRMQYFDNLYAVDPKRAFEVAKNGGYSYTDDEEAVIKNIRENNKELYMKMGRAQTNPIGYFDILYLVKLKDANPAAYMNLIKSPNFESELAAIRKQENIQILEPALKRRVEQGATNNTQPAHISTSTTQTNVPSGTIEEPKSSSKSQKLADEITNLMHQTKPWVSPRGIDFPKHRNFNATDLEKAKKLIDENPTLINSYSIPPYNYDFYWDSNNGQELEGININTKKSNIADLIASEILNIKNDEELLELSSIENYLTLLEYVETAGGVFKPLRMRLYINGMQQLLQAIKRSVEQTGSYKNEQRIEALNTVFNTMYPLLLKHMPEYNEELAAIKYQRDSLFYLSKKEHNPVGPNDAREILIRKFNVPEDASFEAINTKYWEYNARHHPEAPNVVGKDSLEEFSEINRAFGTLYKEHMAGNERGAKEPANVSAEIAPSKKSSEKLIDEVTEYLFKTAPDEQVTQALQESPLTHKKPAGISKTLTVPFSTQQDLAAIKDSLANNIDLLNQITEDINTGAYNFYGLPDRKHYRKNPTKMQSTITDRIISKTLGGDTASTEFWRVSEKVLDNALLSQYAVDELDGTINPENQQYYESAYVNYVIPRLYSIYESLITDNTNPHALYSLEVLKKTIPIVEHVLERVHPAMKPIIAKGRKLAKEMENAYQKESTSNKTKKDKLIDWKQVVQQWTWDRENSPSPWKFSIKGEFVVSGNE